MTELLTAAQMRKLEQAAIDSGAVTGLQLMERAGAGVVEAVLEEWPDLAATAHRAVILCGPGNNGGDGFVVARLLKQRGWEVEVFLHGDKDKLPPDAKTNAERWLELGSVRPLSDFDAGSAAGATGSDGQRCWIVDALFGTGLVRAIAGPLADILRPLTEHPPGVRAPIVSIDIPSGVCSDSGKILGLALPSELTVSFHQPKCGHYLGSAANHASRFRTVSIGLPHDGPHPVTGVPVFTNRDDVAADWYLCGKEASPSNDPTSHKFDHGHALILSGGPGRTGAARLAARGALRIGAGLVTLGVPPAAQMEVASQITAVMLRQVPDDAALAALLQDDRLNALCLGPGLGLGDRAGTLVAGALDAGRPTVLDADALTLIARDAALLGKLHGTCVLTPHTGEFKRLFPDIAGRLEEMPTKGPAYSKVDAVREAADRVGCVVLLKGPATVMADPLRRASVNSSLYDRAAPWLATAGSGDVLAGFIAGLLARSFLPMQAAETAAWLHTECALSFGPGLIAEDLPEELPKVFRALGL